MDTGENIRYVQFTTPQGIGYGCFFFSWHREDKWLRYKISVSFCSPKDQFSKELARKIATGRYAKIFQLGSTTCKNTGYVSDDEFNNILNDLFYRPGMVMPTWAQRAFDKGKYSFSLKNRDV